MVIDTSALIAILQDEPERRSFNDAVKSAERRLMSAATLLETSIIIESRFGSEGVRDLDLYISKAQIDVAPVDLDQAYVARAAYRQYGKGQHRAALNYGDCFSYALAKTEGEPLLFKGTDFVHTDLEVYSA